MHARRSEFWSAMETPSVTMHPLGVVSETAAKLQVSNYTLPKEKPAHVCKLQRVKLMRSVELQVAMTMRSPQILFEQATPKSSQSKPLDLPVVASG